MSENKKILDDAELTQVSGGTYNGPVFVLQVKPGETLDSIANQYRTSVAVLAELNNISNPEVSLTGKKLAIVPILRAGLGMVDGMVSMMPNVKVGHVGLFRDPATLEPVKYYFKMPPDIEERDVIVVDPMLATGGSASAAVTFLKEVGVKHIKLMSIIGAPEGVKRMQEDHPDVDIFVAALDDHLNEHGYIVPGLGDAGDRIFGTK